MTVWFIFWQKKKVTHVTRNRNLALGYYNIKGPANVIYADNTTVETS